MDVEPISAEEFDRRFDDGEDMADYIDWSQAQRVNHTAVDQAPKPLDLPDDLIRRVDQAAERANVSRDALAARFIAEGLDAAA